MTNTTVLVLFVYKFCGTPMGKKLIHLHTLAENCSRFPAKSYHMCTGDLAIKGVLCTRLGSNDRV